jgi:hypothetical protein
VQREEGKSKRKMLRFTFSAWLCACIVVWQASECEALTHLGDLRQYSSFEFVDKFCFDTQDGVVTYYLDINDEWPTVDVENMNILFYSDVSNNWPTAYALSSGSVDDCYHQEDLATQKFSVQNVAKASQSLVVLGDRPRWWYVAISSCERQVIDLPYIELTMTNGNKNNKYSYHFGKNEQGILEMTIVFFIVDVLLLLLMIYSKRICKQLNMQYRVIQLIGLSLVFSCMSLATKMIHFNTYSKDGQGAPNADGLSYFLDAGAQLIQLAILFNIAKGAYISTNHAQNQRVTGVILGVFGVFYIIALSTSLNADPGKVLYIYDTAPGYMLITLRLLCMLLFWKYIHRTFNIETERLRKVFYVVFFCFGSIWLVSFPLMTLIAVSLNSWHREKIVFGLTQSVATLMYLTFWWLFKPWGNDYVPILGANETRAFGNNQLIFPMGPPSIPKTATGVLTSI